MADARLTVLLLVAVAAFIAAVAEAMGKCPGWVPTILLCVFALISAALPIR